MYRFSIVTQEDLTIKDLDSICLIKGIFGLYTIQEQLEWIKYNIKPTDKHLMMYKGHELLGYLNIVNIDLIIDGIETKVFGIGNVCVNEKGKGLGAELMIYLANLLANDNKIGILFCGQLNVGFYNRYGWDLLDSSFCDSETMIFMNGKPFKDLGYSDRLF